MLFRALIPTTVPNFKTTPFFSIFASLPGLLEYLWILGDSRSSIEHLKNSTYIGDKTSLSILQKLKLISLQHDVHFQWIPSHVDIHGNIKADNLAKEGSSHLIPSSSEITFLELYSRKKAQNKTEWLVPPSYHWYKGRKPGLYLSLPCDRQSSTCLSRLASGHLNCLTYSKGNKIYPPSPKCQLKHHLNTFWTV
ncbi:hypothetical protein AVEN_268816-1 [Araneus ventricosus]|uniref:RNase H type-1 domain-containing protein n=1 Tax=Araneus ventricosus TaxID=182803 RepID=A0A4Y2WS48_ARAVE|nr:hypothetical protein AVEN_268816-1 [Araneus ventricosus]